MKRIIFTLVALTLAAGAMAQTQSTSASGSTAAVDGGTINSPLVQVNSAAAERMRSDIHTNQAATPATVFVNPPAADTCAMPGSGLALQLPGGGFGGTLAGEASVRCEMRADVLNLRVTGADPIVIKARQCMDDKMAEAFARAGMPCKDLRPEQPVANAPRQGEPTDPYIRRRMGLQ